MTYPHHGKPITEITRIIGDVSDKADDIKNQSDELGGMVGSYNV